MTTLNEFYDMLQKHDWFHEMNDTYKDTMAGRKELKVIERVSLQSKEHEELYDSYHDYIFGVNIPKPKRPKE